jgi:hypothetical protein
MLGSVPDAQQSGSILSQFGFIRRGDVELTLRRMGATIGIAPIIRRKSLQIIVENPRFDVAIL